LTAPPHIGLSRGNALLQALARNALSQVAGRLMLTVLRFGIVLLIVRRAGMDTFGAYALVMSLVLVAEWIADFGQGDIAVRDLAAQTRPWGVTLGGLSVLKLCQGLLAAPLAAVAAWVLGFSSETVLAALLAAPAVLALAAIQVLRTVFRAQLQLARDIAAELISVGFLVVAVWLLTSRPATVLELVGCTVASRFVHLGVAVLLARGWPRLTLTGGGTAQALVLLRASWPLGVAGLMVAGYDAMDVLALAHWSTPADVGIFNSATRVLMLAVIVVQALSVAVYPVLAAQWSRDRSAFTRTTQATLDTGMLLGGAVFCATWCGAAGLAALFRADATDLVQVLQLLAWALLARVVVTLFAPMVVISGRQVHTLWLTGLVVVAKAIALVLLVPGMGALGAAWAVLVSEIAIGLVPTVLLCQHVAGVRLAWQRALRSLAAAAIVVGCAHAFELSLTLWQGLLAALLFCGLALALGAVPVSELRRVAEALAQRKQLAREAAP
jgi:O-antigen/teichoic acid export membrane protein